MELHELQVFGSGPCLISERDAVSCRDFRVRRVLVQLPRASCRQNNRLCEDQEQRAFLPFETSRRTAMHSSRMRAFFFTAAINPSLTAFPVASDTWTILARQCTASRLSAKAEFSLSNGTPKLSSSWMSLGMFSASVLADCSLTRPSPARSVSWT